MADVMNVKCIYVIRPNGRCDECESVYM
ncbi:hypothetical protein F383_31173 [Gossypium arboreum]|uniref:Uncharacterized protein n=1 Tax=Gossypium arboreum TaxID=29729 RepID=A0A0B0PI59_GOSAR|nr:hypothetical protein F383_31173 [Gossypium arboreum]